MTLTPDHPALFSDINHPATHYAMHPDEIDDFIAGGGVGGAIPRGRYRLRPEYTRVGSVERVQHVPTYRLPTSTFAALSMAEDHSIRLIHPVSQVIETFRIKYFESDANGLTSCYLGSVT